MTSMWRPDREKLVKVRLHDRGEDAETAWAEDLGPVETGGTARRVRIGNVPFLHAKPTYGDVIEVRPDASDGLLHWDRDGAAFEDIPRRIREDGGRWVMIIDYKADLPDRDPNATFQALDIAAERADIAVEGAFASDDGSAGRAYLAIPRSRGVTEVTAWLRSPEVRLDFELIHPATDA